MAIKSVKGHCLKLKSPVGFQFKEAIEGSNRVYYLGGSFVINEGSSGGELKSTDLNGSFQYNQSGKYAGCKLCGQKYIYQCCHCNEFICYDGREQRDVVCPACGKQSSIPATKGDRIVKSSVVSGGNIELIFAMDTSGSMDGSRIVETKRAAISQFIDKFPTAKMAVVKFGFGVATKCGFTNDISLIRSTINGLGACGGTPSPLPHIISNFPEFLRGGNGANRFLLIFTDGAWDSGDHIGDANTIKNAGVKIITIGCAGANTGFLAQIASPGAAIVGGDGKLEEAFANAAKQVTQG